MKRFDIESSLDLSNHTTFTVDRGACLSCADDKPINEDNALLVPFSVAIDLSSRSRNSSCNDSRSKCKTVRFNAHPEVLARVENVADMSKEERSAAYYSSEDLYRMKRALRCTAKWLEMHNCDTTGEKDFCIRGIESMVYYDVAYAKKVARRNASDAVFTEQARQDDFGIFDEESIAAVYRNATAECRARALLKGQSDADSANDEESDEDEV